MTAETNIKELVVAPTQQNNAVSIFADEKQFNFANRVAIGLASSDLVPKQYRRSECGDKAIGNCLIAMDMANRVGMNPLMVMQNLYIVHGNPAWSSQYIRAAINSSGKFSIPQYEFFGQEGTDNYGCKCFATYLASGDKIYGPKVDVKMAKAEGWWTKQGSKWPNMTDVMLQNRAVTFFGRTYCPEVLMGMQSVDEVNDVADINPAKDQKPMSKQEMKDALVGEAIVETVSDQITNEQEPASPNKQEEAIKNDDVIDQPHSNQTNNSSDAAPQWTEAALLEVIEKADTIDTVNDALASTSELDKEAKSRILRAASKKNKELAAKRVTQ